VDLVLGDGAAKAVGHVIVPPSTAAFGVISDIDDTVIVTGATNLGQMMRSLLFENAATRVAFEGIADLYKALHRDRNPIFYVSSSPWNLYDLLADFMAINGIPHGPMFLQDWGIDESTLLHTSHQLHKTREIQSILEYYPRLPFVLIGDSGQRDPEIYLQVIRANPGRIRVAYIRDVTAAPRDRAVGLIAEEAAVAGAEIVHVADSRAALAHANRLGLTSAP
jgi:phosphatidate phosphatase APP1